MSNIQARFLLQYRPFVLVAIFTPNKVQANLERAFWMFIVLQDFPAIHILELPIPVFAVTNLEIKVIHNRNVALNYSTRTILQMCAVLQNHTHKIAKKFPAALNFLTVHLVIPANTIPIWTDIFVASFRLQNGLVLQLRPLRRLHGQLTPLWAQLLRFHL